MQKYFTALSFTAAIVLFLPACGDSDPSGGTADVGISDVGSDVRGVDSDGDGLLDSVEDLNRNGEYEGGEGSNETDLNNADTDGDGLDDGVEDVNLSGSVDPGETDPRLADTDGDGIDDGDEATYGTDPTNPDSDGDGINDGAEVASPLSDPNNADTDGDGVPDGDEDRNGNGIVDPGETSPALTDTDGDGIPDNEENTTIACAADFEPPTRIIEAEHGDWHLQIADAFGDQTIYEDTSIDDRLLRGAFFDAPSADVFGFVISKAPDPDSYTGLTQLQSESIRIGNGFTIADRSVQPLATWDETSGAIATIRVLSGELTASQFRDRMAGAIMGSTGGSPSGAEAPTGPVSSSWVVQLGVSYRSEDRVVIVGAIAPASSFSDDTTRQLLADTTDTTTLSQYGDSSARNCYDLTLSADFFDVDFLWFVDDSISMRDDQDTVAAASDLFFATLQNSLLNFRVAVSSMDIRNNQWWLVEPGFSDLPADFQTQMQSPPGGDLEFGLETAINVLNLAQSGASESYQRFRPGAKRIVILFSDEGDQSVKFASDNGDVRCDAAADPTLAECPPYQEALSAFLEAGVTAYAITGDSPSGCTSNTGPGLSEEPGYAYTQLAYDTGGSFASICSDNLGETVDRIVRSAIGAASNYELLNIPISSTLRIVRNGQPMLRSATNGWDYDPANNQIIFFGSSRPDLDDSVSVGYRYYLDETPDPTGFVPAD